MHTLYSSKDYVRIVFRIQNLKPDSQAKWGKMNVNQMLCHCADPIRGVLDERKYKDRGNIFSKTIIKWIILYMPFNWPKGKLPTVAEFNTQKKGTQPTTFENDKHLLLELLQKVYALPPEYKYPAHPFFGKMGRAGWGRLGYRHLNHHLNQFNE